eukprot:GHVU01202504.1.p1 GENE.GHVU01202504.1~~GHVU01202504.1.p1  ORF type:complete len:671 (+),score=151.35 GHVU01202504.1:43-2055(+)
MAPYRDSSMEDCDTKKEDESNKRPAREAREPLMPLYQFSLQRPDADPEELLREYKAHITKYNQVELRRLFDECCEVGYVVDNYHPESLLEDHKRRKTRARRAAEEFNKFLGSHGTDYTNVYVPHGGPGGTGSNNGAMGAENEKSEENRDSAALASEGGSKQTSGGGAGGGGAGAGGAAGGAGKDVVILEAEEADPYLPLDECKYVVEVMFIPEHIPGSEIRNWCKGLPGLLNVYLSDPINDFNFDRSAWLTFESEDVAKSASQILNTQEKTGELQNDKVTVKLLEFSEYKFKLAPRIASSQMRQQRDLELSRRLIEKFDGVYLEPPYDNPLLADIGDLDSVEARLDLQVLYLRRVHCMSYYGAKAYEDPRRLMEREAAAYLRQAFEPTEATDATKDISWVTVHEAAVEALLRKSLSLPEIVSDDDANVVEAWEQEIPLYIEEVKENERYKCTKCLKSFRGKDFISKHMKNRHRRMFERTKTKAAYHDVMRERFVADPFNCALIKQIKMVPDRGYRGGGGGYSKYPRGRYGGSDDRGGNYGPQRNYNRRNDDRYTGRGGGGRHRAAPYGMANEGFEGRAPGPRRGGRGRGGESSWPPPGFQQRPMPPPPQNNGGGGAGMMEDDGAAFPRAPDRFRFPPGHEIIYIDHDKPTKTSKTDSRRKTLDYGDLLDT